MSEFNTERYNFDEVPRYQSRSITTVVSPDLPCS